jgi:hypothetical protein
MKNQNPAGVAVDSGGVVGIELEASASLGGHTNSEALNEPGDRLPWTSSECNSH